MAACGVWCALLAHTLADLWPRRLISLKWPPLLSILALCGALAAFATLRRSPGWRAIFHCTWPLGLGVFYVLLPTAEPLWGVAALIAGAGGTWWLIQRQNRAPLDAAHPGAACQDRAHPDALAIPQSTGAPSTAGHIAWLWDALAFAVPLTLYILTLAPSVLPGDSGEFQFVVPTLGIPHPTGYPLYLALGKLFSLLPIGSVAYRLNLFSAVAAAGAVWAVYRCGRALGLGRPASLAGAALLMVSETFWSQATIAEKYALHAFWVAVTLWLGLQWHARRTPQWLSAWALCYGLGLAHHRTMVLLAPAHLILIGWTDRSLWRWRPALRLASLILAPLLLYLLLPLFSSWNPPYAYVRVNSLAAFLDLVLARTYQSGIFRGSWAALPGRALEFVRLLLRQFGPLGLGLGIAGWAAMLWRRRTVAWVLLAGMSAQVLFALNYYVPNTFVYYVPAYVWLAVCAAFAVETATSVVAATAPARTSPHLALAWTLLVAALPLYLCTTRWRGMDQRRSYAGLAFDHTYGQMAMRSVEPGALLVSDWLPATVLWYTQYVEGLAPTAQVAAVDSLEWQWKGLVQDALSADRPVYLARPLMEAGRDHPLTSAGPLVRVLSAPQTALPSMSHPLGADLEEGIRLLGSDLVATAPGPEGAIYAIADAPLRGGSTLHVTLYWQAVDAPPAEYAVTLCLADATGHIWLKRQNRHPVGGTYPTSHWQRGEIVADYYALSLPPHLPSGAYVLQASIGVPFAEHALRDESGCDVLPLAALIVRKPLRWPRPALTVSVRKAFGNDLVLMGYDAPREVAPGEAVSLSLQWLVRRPTRAAARPQLVLVRGEGAELAPASLPTSLEDWQPGALVVERYTFTVPEDLERIEVRGADYPIWRFGSWLRRYCLPVHATTAPPPVANFDNQIRLRSYACQRASLKPGETVRLTLEWEAMRALDEPYKVFVHVLGQNGLPIAQQDNEPLNGTYPTTRWQGGERVSDPYAFSLPADLAAGEYQVEVGLYRISDLSRLPVLDEDQSVVDDKVFLTPLTVSGP